MFGTVGFQYIQQCAAPLSKFFQLIIDNFQTAFAFVVLFGMQAVGFFNKTGGQLLR
ncbi:MAG: hypothetical protein KAY66_00320 [Neisseria sp.]|nr:hypothetical protein [Neisseria sp.]